MDVENEVSASSNQTEDNSTMAPSSAPKCGTIATTDTTSAVVTPKLEHDRMLAAMNKFSSFLNGQGLQNLSDLQINEFLNIKNAENNKNNVWKELAQYLPSNMNIETDANYINQIAVHPQKTFSFINYERDVIIPQMNDELLAETYQSMKLQLSGLNLEIARETAHMLKQRNERQAAVGNDGKVNESMDVSMDKNVHSDEDIDIKDMEENDRKVNNVQKYYKNEHIWHCPRWSVAIRADIRTFDWPSLAQTQLETSARLFDVIMMDPPWRLAGSNPTRGVAIGYDQLPDNIIKTLPIMELQGKNSLIFIWVINAKFRYAIGLLEYWGYKLVQCVTWVKQTVNRRIASGHGYYLQHAKELCLVGVKGKLEDIHEFQNNVCADLIYSERRGQSQKPDEIYEYIERMVPRGYYLEIFARRNNLRDGWISVGNEL